MTKKDYVALASIIKSARARALKEHAGLNNLLILTAEVSNYCKKGNKKFDFWKFETGCCAFSTIRT